ncbi:MAG: transposase [Actinobacteria bacterium]|nr:transposase [Actinomycetota bacterium]
MARKHHSIEFQDEACKLVSEQGYTQERAAKELGVTAVTLRSWLRKRGLLEPVQIVEPDYAASDDPKLLRARIGELEKRLRRSETEKEILKKATGTRASPVLAYFASQSR